MTSLNVAVVNKVVVAIFFKCSVCLILMKNKYLQGFGRHYSVVNVCLLT